MWLWGTNRGILQNPNASGLKAKLFGAAFKTFLSLASTISDSVSSSAWHLWSWFPSYSSQDYGLRPTPLCLKLSPALHRQSLSVPSLPDSAFQSPFRVTVHRKYSFLLRLWACVKLAVPPNHICPEPGKIRDGLERGNVDSIWVKHFAHPRSTVPAITLFEMFL